MKNSLVSVITVTYNKGNTIERTIKSVIGQDYPYIEYIVVDGCSSDNTVSIIEKYEKKISKFISEPDKGPIDAFNKALEMITGDIVVSINSDDYFEPGVISTVMNTFHEHPEIDVVHANLRYFNLKTNEILVCKPFKKTGDIYKNIYKWPAIFTITFFIKKELLFKIEPFDLSENIASDFELYLKLLKNNAQFFYLDQIIINHQSGGRSFRSIRGYIQIKDISLKYDCSKLKAYYYLIIKLLERSVDYLFIKCGLKSLRHIFIKLFYLNIKVVKRD